MSILPHRFCFSVAPFNWKHNTSRVDTVSTSYFVLFLSSTDSARKRITAGVEEESSSLVPFRRSHLRCLFSPERLLFISAPRLPVRPRVADNAHTVHVGVSE